jgi:hypothetical protein
MDKTIAQAKKLGVELKTSTISSFQDFEQFIRAELPSHESIVPALILGLPLGISLLLHFIEHRPEIVILHSIIVGLVAAIMTIICRHDVLLKKFITTLIVLTFVRLIADLTAFKLIILSLLPWITEAVLEELKQDIKTTKSAKREQKVEQPKPAEPIETPSTPKSIETPPVDPPQPIVPVEAPILTPVVASVGPRKLTKKYIDERRAVTVNLRQTLDLKGDRAYEYLIKRFRKHALGRFFENDYHYTKDGNLKLIQDNMAVLLSHENTHQIWTHMYSTEFAFIFPEDIMPKGRDIKWEIDTFLLYAALCRILCFQSETEILFKHYNTLQTVTQDNLILHGGHEGVKVVILPGENQPYLVRYTMRIEYLFNAREHQYVDHISSKGIIDLKLTPYVALKDVKMCLETSPTSPILSSPPRSSLRMPTSLGESTKREPSATRTPVPPTNPQPNAVLGSNIKDRESQLSGAFVDSSLKK